MPTINHPIHLLDRAAMVAMSLMPKTADGSMTGPDARGQFDKLMARTPGAHGVTYHEAQVGGVLGWWCRPNETTADAAILYFHGGAYRLGSARAYRHLAGQLAVRAKVAAFVPEYGLAAEHRFPTPVNEAQAAYHGLVEQGFTRIALAGDSSGGGLALVLLSLEAARARGGGGSSPVGAAVMSPWTDLALTGASLETRAEADPLLTREALATSAQLYLDGRDARDPQASPLYGDLAGLPPVTIHVGEDEILLDDSLRYSERFESAGGTCQVHTWEGMTHVFPTNLSLLRDAKEALDEMGDFLRHLI